MSRTHVYILFHGAAMALYMFLPKNAAIIEVSSHMCILLHICIVPYFFKQFGL